MLIKLYEDNTFQNMELQQILIIKNNTKKAADNINRPQLENPVYLNNYEKTK